MAVRKRKLKRKLREEDELIYSFFAHESFKNEPANLIGIEQFVLYTSTNTEPKNPNKYFLKLKSGRQWFFWLQEQLRQDYNTSYWPGIDNLKNDWKDNLFILKRLLSWSDRLSKMV